MASSDPVAGSYTGKSRGTSVDAIVVAGAAISGSNSDGFFKLKERDDIAALANDTALLDMFYITCLLRVRIVSVLVLWSIDFFVVVVCIPGVCYFGVLLWEYYVDLI